ncbi:MAG: hypothetical protein IPJ77_23995 [Planctomycetes bacterium]|nr:hypothetical protein [Planctomycetota bacterium]
MLHAFFFALTLSLPSAGESAPSTHETAVLAPQAQQDAEFEKRRKEAGNDVDKLWDVYKWCKEQKKDEKGRSVLRQIIKLDPNHEDANTALGYVKYDGKWFPSQKKVDEYKKEQAGKPAASDGLVDYKGQRVPPADVPFLEKGMVRDDSGNWVDGEEYKKKKDGWVRQDLDWVSPQEKENLDKGLWKCGDKWLSLEEANKFHSELFQWWRIPTERYHLYTTCDRAVAMEKVKKQLDAAWEDLSKIFQVQPTKPVVVIVLRDDRQYNTYAGGDEEAGIPAVDTRGLASAHYAFFSEVALDMEGQFLLPGIAYWDASTEAGNKWGVHAVRSALGLAFADAIDPSIKTIDVVREVIKKKRNIERSFLDDFNKEKRLPEWFRTGAATYAERYFIDIFVGQGGNSHWARDWSVSNIVNKGGLRPLKQLLDAKLTIEGGDAAKLMNEMGLVMAFIVDGKCASVTEKYKALQDALKSDKDKKEISAAIQALAEDVMKHETDLRKFAGI